MKRILSLVALLPLLSACDTINGYSRGYVGQVFSPQEVLVLQESNIAAGYAANSSGSSGTGSTGSSAPSKTQQTPTNKQDVQVIPVTERMLVAMLAPDDLDQSLDSALSFFYQQCKNISSDQKSKSLPDGYCKLVRNRIQDRIIFSSNSACRLYKNNLKQFHATENTAFGSFTTLLGGIGAMTTAAVPARILSGGAGISSGLNSQVNENIYSTLAVEVITKAIDKARIDELREITKNRAQDIDNYTVERAIADADVYHSRCSLLSGLQEASTSVNKAGSPSASDLNDVLKQLNQSVTLKLGQNSTDFFNGQTVFASAVCESTKTKFDALYRKAAADRQPQIKTDWDSVYSASCGRSKELDEEVVTAVKNYSKSTDDSTRQSYLDTASILQMRIKNINAILENKLQSISQ